MGLSERMKAVADMVKPCERAADIGTDHAYIPICLVESGRVGSVIAMDVNAGPLERAGKNVAGRDLEDRIDLRLSDGMAALEKGEAQTLLISGMGGLLMEKILREGREKLECVGQLVLQPQSDADVVRHFIYESGFMIDAERMVLDAGKYYQVFSCVKSQGSIPPRSDYTLDEDFIFGKILIDDSDPLLRTFLQMRLEKIEEILRNLEENATAAGNGRIDEVNRSRKLTARALTRIKR